MIDIACPLTQRTERDQCSFYVIPAKKAWSESGHEKTLDGPRQRNLIQNERPVPFKTVRVCMSRKDWGTAPD